MPAHGHQRLASHLNRSPFMEQHAFVVRDKGGQAWTPVWIDHFLRDISFLFLHP